MTCKELETARFLNKILHVDIYVGTDFFGVDFVMWKPSILAVDGREPLQDTRYNYKKFRSHAALLKFLQWFEKLPVHPDLFQNQDKLQYPYRLWFTSCT